MGFTSEVSSGGTYNQPRIPRHLGLKYRNVDIGSCKLLVVVVREEAARELSANYL